jgi:hypothetical protein
VSRFCDTRGPLPFRRRPIHRGRKVKDRSLAFDSGSAADVRLAAGDINAEQVGPGHCRRVFGRKEVSSLGAFAPLTPGACRYKSFPGRVTFTASRPNTHAAALLGFFRLQLRNLPVLRSTNIVQTTGLEISSWKDASPFGNMNRRVPPNSASPATAYAA